MPCLALVWHLHPKRIKDVRSENKTDSDVFRAATAAAMEVDMRARGGSESLDCVHHRPLERFGNGRAPHSHHARPKARQERHGRQAVEKPAVHPAFYREAEGAECLRRRSYRGGGAAIARRQNGAGCLSR